MEHLKAFEKYNDYKKRIKGITILYPGAFKPLTGAHMKIIETYLQHQDVKKVILFMSPAKRDIVDVDVAMSIAENLLIDLPVEIILDKNSYSPVIAIYNWIEKKEREPGKYALVSSTKGNDYRRVVEFVKSYKQDKFGKKLAKGVKIIEMPMDVEILTYSNGNPISATYLRESLKEKDYDKFKENYPELEEEKIKVIWDRLNSEEIEEAGNTGFVEAGNLTGYERTYPIDKYRTSKNIVT